MKKTDHENEKKNNNLCKLFLAVVAIAVLALPGAVFAQTDAGTLDVKNVAHNEPDYSPFVDRHVPDRVLWGDTHLHTKLSLDSGFFGNLGFPRMYTTCQAVSILQSPVTLGPGEVELGV